jgi:uncharacterized 2Fe-2S/4Fe-4S cluster protein (DUF4445 family)
MSIRVKILPEDRTVTVPAGRTLAEVLEQNGIRLSLYCGQRGMCGKCFVEIVRGELGDPDSVERRFIEGRKLPPRSRMSCRYRPAGDVVIRIPAASRLPEMPVFRTGIERRIFPDPAVRTIAVPLGDPGPSDDRFLLDRVRNGFPRGKPVIPADVLREIARRAAAEEAGASPVWTAALYEDRDIIDLEPGDTAGSAVGLAVDLGTTTMVAELVELDTGKVLGSAASVNPQTAFGADVVSRITAGYLAPDRVADMRDAVVAGLNILIGELARSSGRAADKIYEAVIAGNTAMNHLLLAMPVASLAVAPFAGLFSALPPLPARESGLGIHPRGRVYIAPNIRSFVGGDISAGLAATDLEHREGNHLFIDLGTNGEIVLKAGPDFTATSTAAGPAFEGMSISCGMLALPGAVHRADLHGEEISVRTIGGAPARGVCGTGLIDLLALALRKGLMTPAGHILDPSKRIPFAVDLALTQKDVREVQLAAAAVKTGMRMLLSSAGLDVTVLDGLIVAGAFGNELNIAHAVSIGLLPRIDRKKIQFVGNSSLAGARALLLSRAERARCERLASRIRHIGLAKDKEFQETYIESLELAPWP